MMADQVESDDPSQRRSPVPGEPVPLAAASGERSSLRAPGEPRGLRLTASASRRNAPDRSTASPARQAPDSPVVVPQQEPPAVRSGRWGWAVGVGVGVVLVLVCAAVLLRPAGRPDTEPVRAVDAGAAAPARGEFDPPVALAADSEYVETEVVDGSDDLLVTHWISTQAPMDGFRVRPPSGPGLDGLSVDVEDLVVAADGVPVRVDDLRLDVPQVLAAAHRLYVRYRLAGALERTGSVRGRALATVTSLGIDFDGQLLPRTQSFPDGRVMTLACLARAARAVPASCGADEDGTWRLESAGDEVPVTVIAQFDLAATR